MCDTQEEVDHCWQQLGAGSDDRAQQCGWLTDKFGLSWQAVPKSLPEMLQDSDAGCSQRAFAARLSMKKLDVAKLQEAYTGH